MPISTLKNLSVQDGGNPGNATMLMPKLQYRFRVIVEGFGTGGGADSLREFTRQVIDVTRPNLSFEQITIDSYNSRTYMAGKHTWEPITLTLRDDANDNIQRMVGQQLQKQFDFWEQSSAVSAASYKFKTSIQILDGGNGENAVTVLDKYNLVGCYVESANYNSLNYATNDPVQVSLTIRYDNAIQFADDSADDAKANSNGVGMNIGERTGPAVIIGQQATGFNDGGPGTP